MAYVTTWLSITVLMWGTIWDAAESTTLCAQCNSKHDKDCESDPPSASDCLERTSKRNGCLITRIYSDGQQKAFIRSCSTLDQNVPREGCVNDTLTGNKQRKCYVLCFEDGCNKSDVISGYSLLVIVMVVLLSLFVS
ncbi:uncharacterized protein LOC125669885 [Ostrea edulis]|uniref:uncharacterized protein LOC125669885 n=1 Tax=Ostrea edulis TaxID=37623 RepID=UPI0024AF035A|nr:uncharacterized protein LOC125669885 [Ostrea edulis]